MQIAILVIVTMILIGLTAMIPYIKQHLKDIEEETSSNHESLKMLTENLDEFEFEKGFKKWVHIGSRARNKKIAQQYLGWIQIGNEWQARDGELYDEPSDFEGENFDKFVHGVRMSEADRVFILYCILWQKGFKIF
jgi:hypothetical protein